MQQNTLSSVQTEGNGDVLQDIRIQLDLVRFGRKQGVAGIRGSRELRGGFEDGGRGCRGKDGLDGPGEIAHDGVFAYGKDWDALFHAIFVDEDIIDQFAVVIDQQDLIDHLLGNCGENRRVGGLVLMDEGAIARCLLKFIQIIHVVLIEYVDGLLVARETFYKLLGFVDDDFLAFFQCGIVVNDVDDGYLVSTDYTNRIRVQHL